MSLVLIVDVNILGVLRLIFQNQVTNTEEHPKSDESLK